MKAPIDKVGPNANPRNDILQIVISRACDIYTCSSCTQLLPFRKDTRFMSLECFRQACRSMKGWPGVVACFGGNPCSHPGFDEIVWIMCQEFPDQRQRGLWTNNLLGKGEAARRLVWPHGRTNLNVHENSTAADEMRKWLPGMPIVGEHKSSWHSPILMDYRDFGMSEQDWISAREACDINQKWSGSVVERDGKIYGYFCEVASALDGITGRNHGIEAHPGWWKLPMSYFQEQVAKCCDAGCGVPLRRKGSLDKDGTYDVSPSWANGKLNGQNHVSITVHPELPESTAETTDYQAVRTTK